MGVLARSRDGALFQLPSQCLLGRSSAVAIQLDERYASQEHAKLMWTGAQWELRDLASRNGTFMNGKRIEPGKSLLVPRGTGLGFGAPDSSWTLSDASGPLAFAVDLDSLQTHTAIGEILSLPDDGEPLLSLYPGAGSWLLEDADGQNRPVQDREIITLEGRRFRVELPSPSEATPMLEVTQTFENASLEFYVSRDEERVSIRVVTPSKRFELEPRWFGYLLVTLARERKKDAQRPIPARGWRGVDDLMRMLRIDSNALNVATHKARQQFSALGIEGAAKIVEVRRGERRLGTDRFEIGVLDEE